LFVKQFLSGDCTDSHPGDTVVRRRLGISAVLGGAK
jgi:hypothetical protein